MYSIRMHSIRRYPNGIQFESESNSNEGNPIEQLLFTLISTWATASVEESIATAQR